MSNNFGNLNIPRHLAIIPDGNRRWAKANNLPSMEGHRKGSDNFEKLIDKSRELGIEFFTGWAFSTENWKRAQEENQYLFNLAREYAKRYKKKFLAEKVRFFHLGRKDRLPKDIVELLIDLEEETKEYTDFTVNIAMDYGGHNELVRAFNKLVKDNKPITEKNIEMYLDTRGIIPQPDLLIRTSGEMRLSGFMPWQTEYTELYFPQAYFPDFTPEELVKAIEIYSNRERRFGGDSA